MLRYLVFLLLILCSGCRVTYQPSAVEFTGYTIHQPEQDTVLSSVMQPYRTAVNREMNEVLGICSTTLEKAKPEGTLGNFMTDAILVMASSSYKVPVDVAVINYGGIRLPQLPAGEVTRSKVFELMPFDNALVLLKVPGKLLQDFLDFIAAGGGWPVAGINMQIENKKAVNVRIGDKPLVMEKTYIIALSDFLVNGGDNVTFFKDIPVMNNGLLVRDAIIGYINQLKKNGQQINASLEGRITYVK